MSSTAVPFVAVGVLRRVTIDDADAATCEALIGTIRQLRGWVDSVEVTLTSRMRQLHDTAGGAPAADLHSRCGGVSSAEAKRKERRSETIDDAPLFGDALANGAVGAEHVDALANATSKLRWRDESCATRPRRRSARRCDPDDA